MIKIKLKYLQLCLYIFMAWCTWFLFAI